VYGKTQEAVAKDEAFAKLYAHTATFAELTGRNISVGVLTRPDAILRTT
jgi:hypothetical protein